VVFRHPSEKYEFVSWDDYSQYMESHKIAWFQTTNQILSIECLGIFTSSPNPAKVLGTGCKS